MPKYGQVHFGNVYFGESEPPTENWKRSFANIPLGLQVRRQLGKQVIFRVRRGNGHAGAVAGVAYQDKYKYVVPGSINNVESKPYRTHFAAAVDYWKNILTTEEKQAYNIRASKGLRMAGYHLFMREAMNGGVQMFVNRGDPPVYDFAKEDLTLDGAWHDLDLSAIVPDVARAVFIVGHVEGNGIDWTIMFRKKGNTNEVNHGGMETIRANVERHRSSTVAIGPDQIIQYKADNQNWATLSLAVRAWWT